MKHQGETLMLKLLTLYAEPMTYMTLNQRINTKANILKELNYEYATFFNGKLKKLMTGELR